MHGHDGVLGPCRQCAGEMLFVDASHPIVLVPRDVIEDEIDCLLQGLELGAMDDIMGNLVRQNGVEHGLQVRLWYSIPVQSHVCLPFTNPVKELIRTRAFWKRS